MVERKRKEVMTFRRAYTIEAIKCIYIDEGFAGVKKYMTAEILNFRDNDSLLVFQAVQRNDTKEVKRLCS